MSNMASNLDAKSLAQQLSVLTKDSFAGDDDACAHVIIEAQKLIHRLEDPYVAIKRMTFNEPTLICTILIADKMRLFAALGPVGSRAQDVAELAAPLSAEHELVKRVMRHLAAHEVVGEFGGDKYGPTHLSSVLADTDSCVGFREVAARYMPIFGHAAGWLADNGYRCPRDARDTVFQGALGRRGQSFFDWLQLPEHKHASDEFGRLMRVGVHGAKSWLDVVRRDRFDNVLSAWDGQSAVLVDIGGSLGQDVREFRRRHPAVRGDLFVQDLPATIALAEKESQQLPDDATIHLQPHDFFKEEPVKGALMYFMGSILHDWPDDDARLILRNVAAAMKPGYSTLFLSEIVLPETACHPHVSAIDICMLVELGAKERSQESWRQLLADEGLELIQVHTSPLATRSVVEVRLSSPR